MADEWPLDLLEPENVDWQPVGGSLSSGRTGFGPPRRANTTGGPYWICRHEAVFLHSPDQVKVARALQALADGGSTAFVVPSCERRFAPAGLSTTPAVPFSDGATFSDGALFAEAGGQLAVGAAAPLRATTLILTLPDGVDMDVCDVSIEHPTKSHRRYRVARVLEQIGTTATVTVRPPLREAVVGGEAIEALRPKCLMVLTNADEFFGALMAGRYADASPQFEEAP